MFTNAISPLSKLKQLTYSCVSLAGVFLLGLVFYPCFLPESSHAEPGVDATPTLSVSGSNEVAFSLTPGTFNSASQTISASTTNFTGYTLTLRTTGASTSLKDNSTQLTLPTIDLPAQQSSITSSSFDNEYGYSLNGTDYKPVPDPASSGIEIDSTSVANPTANTYTLTFGAKVDSSVPAGLYQNTFSVTATAKPTGYIITYNANAGSDTVTGMPNPLTQQGTISGLSVQLSNAEPERDGYTFLGWDESSSATEPTYEAGDTFTLDPETANSKTLYAVWEQDLVSMIGFQCSSLNTGATANVYDPRDNNVYKVGKLADGKCWMLDNLRLSDSTVALTSENSNLPYSSENPYYLPSSSTLSLSFTTPELNSSEVDTIAMDHYGAGSGKIGVQYNFCAASGGTVCDDGLTAVSDATHDICPSGWSLPSKDNYLSLIHTYDSTFTASGWGGSYLNSLSDSLSIATDLSLGGNGRGEYYTSTHGMFEAAGYDYMWAAISTSDYNNDLRIGLTDYVGREMGAKIRCIASDDASLAYNANGGSNAPASEVAYSKTGSFSFTISNSEPTREGYIFIGWNEDEDATTPDYQAGDTFTTNNTASTLYAVWTDKNLMQYVSSWEDSVAMGDTIEAIDIRDNTIYTVARLNDGKLWMTKNLRFDFSQYGDKITTQNTNNPTNSFIASASAKPTSYSDFRYNSYSNMDYDVLRYSTLNIGNTTIDSLGHTYDEYGIYYNWYTATAGNGLTTTWQATGDLCPSGWHLPIGGDEGEFKVLNDTQNSGLANSSLGLTSSPANFVYSGGIMTSSNYYDNYRGQTGNYWSSTSTEHNHHYSNYQNLHVLAIQNDYVSTSATASQENYNGLTVRCVAGTNFTLSYDANDGIDAPLTDPGGYSNTGIYTFTISNTIPTHPNGYTFLGWSEDSSAIFPSYQPGETFVTSNSHAFLYAVWMKEERYALTYDMSFPESVSVSLSCSSSGGENIFGRRKLGDHISGVVYVPVNYCSTFSLRWTSLDGNHLLAGDGAFSTSTNISSRGFPYVVSYWDFTKVDNDDANFTLNITSWD